MLLREEVRRPSGVMGPWDLAPLIRFAMIWRSEDMVIWLEGNTAELGDVSKWFCLQRKMAVNGEKTGSEMNINENG